MVLDSPVGINTALLGSDSPRRGLNAYVFTLFSQIKDQMCFALSMFNSFPNQVFGLLNKLMMLV